MKFLLFIAIVVSACDSSTSKIRLTSPGATNSEDAGSTVPDRDVIVVNSGAGKSIATDSSKPPGNLETTPSTPSPPLATIKDVDAKLPPDLKWVVGSGTSLSPDALAGGSFGDSASYICRALHGGAYLPGQLSVATGLCYIADGTAVVGYANFEVLTLLSDDAGTVLSVFDTTTAEIPSKSMAFGLKAGKVQYLCLVSVGVDVYVGRVDDMTAGCLYVDIDAAKALLIKTYSIVTTVP